MPDGGGWGHNQDDCSIGICRSQLAGRLGAGWFLMGGSVLGNKEGVVGDRRLRGPQTGPLTASPNQIPGVLATGTFKPPFWEAAPAALDITGQKQGPAPVTLPRWAWDRRSHLVLLGRFTRCAAGPSLRRKELGEDGGGLEFLLPVLLADLQRG